MFSPYSFLWRKQNPLNKHAFYNQWFLFWSAPAGPPGLLKSIQFWPSAEIFESVFKKAVKCKKIWIFSLGSSQKTRHRLCSTVTNNNAEPNVVHEQWPQVRFSSNPRKVMHSRQCCGSKYIEFESESRIFGTIWIRINYQSGFKFWKKKIKNNFKEKLFSLQKYSTVYFLNYKK